MAQLLGAIANMVEYATRPPAPPVDRTYKPIPHDKLDELIKEAKDFYKMDKPSEFHVAVVGAKGAGKSSLINGLCNMQESQPDAAPNGGTPIGEAKAYRKFMHDALVLWEFPGAGVGHPSASYFADKKLYAFDLIMLVSDRFQRVDFEVAKAALHHGRRFIFVRTKADLAMKRIVEREKGHTTVQEAMKALRKEVDASFREGLRLAGLAERWNSMTLFLVSSKEYLEGTTIYKVLVDSNMNEEDDDDDDDDAKISGDKLDEDTLFQYLTTLIRNRVRRSRTRRF